MVTGLEKQYLRILYVLTGHAYCKSPIFLKIKSRTPFSSTSLQDKGMKSNFMQDFNLEVDNVRKGTIGHHFVVTGDLKGEHPWEIAKLMS